MARGAAGQHPREAGAASHAGQRCPPCPHAGGAAAASAEGLRGAGAASGGGLGGRRHAVDRVENRCHLPRRSHRGPQRIDGRAAHPSCTGGGSHSIQALRAQTFNLHRRPGEARQSAAAAPAVRAQSPPGGAPAWGSGGAAAPPGCAGASAAAACLRERAHKLRVRRVASAWSRVHGAGLGGVEHSSRGQERGPMAWAAAGRNGGRWPGQRVPTAASVHRAAAGCMRSSTA